jgi:hypothetical protein
MEIHGAFRMAIGFGMEAALAGGSEISGWLPEQKIQERKIFSV